MFRRIINSLICLAFIFGNLQFVQAQDFSVNLLPVPGTLVGLSAPYTPVLMKGLKIHPENPFLLDFIMDAGKNAPASQELKSQSEMMVKYFLAALTVPDKDLWVNLSPYEKDRIVPYSFSRTELGRDLLAEDYILKQATASAIYPENELGKAFWSRVYRLAQEKYGTTQIPVNTFNKVWIVADKVSIFEKNQSVYIVDSRLKVMLEEDYLALQKHIGAAGSAPGVIASEAKQSLSTQIIRQIILPVLENEVNTGKNFAPLRQAYNSVILAAWFKRALKNAVLNEVYANQNKVAGIDLASPQAKEQIFQRYLEAYKKGAFNYIKEDIDSLTNQAIPRKYFSGGMKLTPGPMNDVGQQLALGAMAGEKHTFDVKVGLDDEAMTTADDETNPFNEASLLLGQRSASNEPVVLEKSNLKYFRIGRSLKRRLENAVPLDNVTEIDLKRLTSKNLDAVDGVNIATLKYQLGAQREELNSYVSSGEMGNVSLNHDVEFKVISEEANLPFGYVFDFDKQVVYIKPSFLKRINESNGYCFQFFARAILKMNAKPVVLPDPIFSDNDSEQVRQEKIDLRDGQQTLLTGAARLELEVKYMEEVYLPRNPSVKEAYDKLFKEFKPEDMKKALADAIKFRTLPTALAAINEIKGTFTKAPPESVGFVPPSVETIELNKELYRLGVAAANIMAVNAMNGISEYASRSIEALPTQRLEGNEIVKGVELKLVNTSTNKRKTKIHFTPSKFNPPTWAHTIITILLPFALSGADVLIVSPSEFSDVKREINKTARERTDLLTVEMRGILGDLPYILHGNTFLSKDKELKLPFKQINNMRYWNGEEVLYMLCQQFDGQLESVSYAAGGDYNYLAQPSGSVSTFDSTGQINPDPDNKNPDIIDYYLFWYLSSPQLYREFLRLQNEGIPGSEYNRPFDIGSNNESNGTVPIISPTRLAAIKRQAVNRKVFEALLLDPVNEAWYTNLNLIHKFFNSQDFPVMPRFLVPAKLFMIQHRFPQIKITHALTMRQGEFKGDDIIPMLVREGLNGQRLSRMNIPGLLSAVSGTALRENGLKKLLKNVVDSNGLPISKNVGEYLAIHPDVIVKLLRLDDGFSWPYPVNINQNTMRQALAAEITTATTLHSSVLVGEKNTRIGIGTSDYLEFSVQHKYTPDGAPLNVVLIQTWEIKNKKDRTDINGVLKKFLSKNAAPGVITQIANEHEFLENPQKDMAMSNSKKPAPALRRHVVRNFGKARADSVMPGGIDLNVNNALWLTRRENGGVSLRADPALIAQIRRQGVPGLSPVVISITPIKNLAAVFGLN